MTHDFTEVRPRYEALRAQLKTFDDEIKAAELEPSDQEALAELMRGRAAVAEEIVKLKASLGFPGMDDFEFGWRVTSATPWKAP